MIPENKKAIVADALQATFGTSEIDDMSELTAGLSSAVVLRIIVLGKPYLLRIITRTDAISAPALEYACMRAAAEAGIAPRVWYTDLDERIAITDFINAKPFPLDEAKTKMPALLKRLHSLPPFPFRINYLDSMDRFVQKFQADKIIPADVTGEIFHLYAKIKDLYPRNNEDLVACHNDLKPENTLYDGERLWLVDWEAAFLNDRYLDLSIAANFLIRNDGDEKDYLQAYFGNNISEYQHARFFLMRQLLHVFYFVTFMITGKTPGKPVDFSIPKFSFREFNDLIWAGEINLAGMDARQQYAMVHIEHFKYNARLKRFEESLEIVGKATLQ